MHQSRPFGRQSLFDLGAPEIHPRFLLRLLGGTHWSRNALTNVPGPTRPDTVSVRRSLHPAPV